MSDANDAACLALMNGDNDEEKEEERNAVGVKLPIKPAEEETWISMIYKVKIIGVRGIAKYP